MLLVAVVLVVIMFKTSSALASAYGVAVTADMVITSCLAIFVLWKYWEWPLWRVLVLMVPLLLVEQAFFAANMLKVLEGWVPLLIAGAIGLLMWTWVRARGSSCADLRRTEADLGGSCAGWKAKPSCTRTGHGGVPDRRPRSPPSLMHNLKHNRVLHERNIILSIRHEDVPRVPRHERVIVDRTSDTFTRVARYGFMETPSVPKILDHAGARNSTSTWARRPSSCRAGRCGARAARACRAGKNNLHHHGALLPGRHDVLPDPDGPRGRDRHAGGHLIGTPAIGFNGPACRAMSCGGARRP